LAGMKINLIIVDENNDLLESFAQHLSKYFLKTK
jgi:hypothetical protein